MKKLLLCVAVFIALPAAADPFTLCDVTTRGTRCRMATITGTVPPQTISQPIVPAAPPLTQPVFCEIRVVYEEGRPDVTNVAALVPVICSEDHARAALSSKLNDLLLGERLPR